MMHRFSNKYILFSMVFWFPPFHELGHVFICYLTGSVVTSVDWWGVVYHTVTPWDWIHALWEYTVLIPLLLVIVFIYLECKALVKKNVTL